MVRDLWFFNMTLNDDLFFSPKVLNSLLNLKDDGYLDVSSTCGTDGNPFSLDQAHQVSNIVALSDNLEELLDFILPDNEVNLQIEEINDKYNLKMSDTTFAK